MQRTEPAKMTSPNYIFLGVLVLICLGVSSAHRVLLDSSTDNDKPKGPDHTPSHTQPMSKLGSGGSCGCGKGSFCDGGCGGGCSNSGGPPSCGPPSFGVACPSFPGTGGGFLCGSVPPTPHCGGCPPAVGSPTCSGCPPAVGSVGSPTWGGCPPAGWGASGCPTSGWGSSGGCFQMNSIPGMAAGSNNGAHNEPMGSQAHRTGQAVLGDGEPALPNDDGSAVPLSFSVAFNLCI